MITSLSDRVENTEGNGVNAGYKVENTVVKGELTHYQQFLLVPWCFQKTCTAGT